jgi:hypothetical protein
MKQALALILLAAMFVAGSAYAADDPILGTWTLNVAKSKFSPGPAPSAGTRVYSESAGLYTLDEKFTGADGKETSVHAQYRNGHEVKGSGDTSPTVLAKKVNSHTWNFDLKMDGKVVGHVHRVVSADGKVLTVHNTGQQGNAAAADDTLVFDKQ